MELQLFPPFIFCYEMGEWSPMPHIPVRMDCTTTAQNNGTNLPLIDTSKTVSQNKPFFFVGWFIQGICYSHRKLTVTSCQKFFSRIQKVCW